MRTKIISGALALGVTAASAFEAISQPATDKETKDVFFAYFSCLNAAASKMDDGKSDASTIALGIKSMCASQFAHTVELEGRNLNPAARRMFESEVQNKQLEFATRAVLRERAARDRPR